MIRAEAVRAWLRERGAETVDHPGGTTPEHADYFRELVEAWAPLLSPAVLAAARGDLAR